LVSDVRQFPATPLDAQDTNFVKAIQDQNAKACTPSADDLLWLLIANASAMALQRFCRINLPKMISQVQKQWK